VLRGARSDPTRLFVGIDADAGWMRETARRASRGRLDNAAFVVARAEALPAELIEVADEVTVSFPWGSLLSGLVGPDGDDVVRSLSSICRPGATVTVVWSLTAHDVGAPRQASPREIRARFSSVGLEVVELRAASPAEVAATGSSWAKRLGAGTRRGATVLRARRR
jgi:16S rRNA (adenine(1408)-N(1))-methyltransferase